MVKRRTILCTHSPIITTKIFIPLKQIYLQLINTFIIVYIPLISLQKIPPPPNKAGSEFVNTSSRYVTTLYNKLIVVKQKYHLCAFKVKTRKVTSTKRLFNVLK